MPKRARDPQDDASSQIAAVEAPRRKKSRMSVAVPSESPAKGAGVTPSKTSKPSSKKKQVPQNNKRPLLPGRLNRLAVPKPQSLAARKGGTGSTRPDVNRRGNKINKGWGTGGFDTIPPAPVVAGAEDIGELASDKDKKQSGSSKKSTPVGAEMWITRKSAYSAYLKSGVSAFMQKGNHTLILRALGAAIPVCLSLTLAIRDALPCGEEGTTMEVRTGSVDVNDEIIPEDGSENEDEDIQYQIRTKSSVECIISLKKNIRQRLLVSSTGVSANHTLGAKTMGVRPGRGGRGKPVRGGIGRHSGRGRGGGGGRGS